MFACFFQTNFPNIPFLKPKLLSFWLFIYFFCCFCFCSHISCFCLSVLMLALFLVCFILLLSCFSFVSCFAFTDYEKHCFPCNSSVFSHAGYKVVLYFFSFMFLVLFVFFSCVVCFHFRHLICIMLCLCCLVFSFLKKKNRTKWFCCLHLVVIFPFCCFVLNFVFFLFFHSSQKKTPQKTGHSKNPKKQKCRKNGQKKIS